MKSIDRNNIPDPLNILEEKVNRALEVISGLRAERDQLQKEIQMLRRENQRLQEQLEAQARTLQQEQELADENQRLSQAQEEARRRLAEIVAKLERYQE